MKNFSIIIFLLFFSFYNSGLLNGQTTWYEQNPLPTGEPLNGIHVFNENSAIIIGQHGRVFKTDNGGLSWTQKQINTTNWLKDIYFVNDSVGWLVGDGDVIRKSIDGGETWTDQFIFNAGNLYWVQFLNENIGWARGNSLYYTDNGGSTWTALSNSYGVLHFVNNNIGYGADSYVVHKTTNGGLSWVMVSHPSTEFMNDTYFVNEMKGWAVGNNGAIIATTDAGASWTLQASNVTSDLVSLDFVDENNGWAVGTLASQVVLHTTNGGLTWATQIDTVDNLNYFNRIMFDKFNPDAGWVIGGSGFISRTSNGGINWVKQKSAVTEKYLNSVHFKNSNIGWAAGRFGTIVKTTDGGETWSNKNSNISLEDFYSIRFIDEVTGWAVGTAVSPTNSVIVKSTDGGESWTSQNSNITTNLSEVSFADANNGWAVGSSGKILNTTDGGQTWVSQTSGLTTTLNSVYFISGTTGWTVGTSGKILKTTNAGLNWIAQTSGLTTSLLSVFFIDSSTGWAAGLSGKILKTTNGGTSWGNQPSGTTLQSFQSISFVDKNNGWITASTGNLWVTTNGGTNWSQESTNTPSGALEICFVDVNTGWGVGSNGKIMKKGIRPNVLGPSALNAVPDTSFIYLNWMDNSVNEIGFSIERKLGGVSENNPFIFVDAVPANQTSFQDINLTSGTTYTYRIYAYSNFGNSNYSNMVEVTTLSGSTTFQLTVSIGNGWNMSSIPGLHPVNQNVTTWWPGKDTTANVFKYSNSYQSVTTTTPGEGYWMKHSGDTTYNTGEEWPAGGILPTPHNPIAANAGWNLIGGYEISALVSGLTTTPAGLQDGPVYGYSGGYQQATNIVPGYGYWIKLTGAGQINIPDVLNKSTNESKEEFIKADWGKIIITDNANRTYTLYAVKGEVNLNSYELPPVPPAGMFDIRYGSGRIAEELSNGNQSILLSGIEYPVKVKVEDLSINLEDESGKIVKTSLTDGQEITIQNSSVNKLRILSGEIGLPEVYSLEQNYPNPFNPSTTIRFALPEAGNVKLTIYNVIGEKVTELVNNKLDAGRYSYKWDASNIATGLYIYELRTDKFVSVKKMMFLK